MPLSRLQCLQTQLHLEPAALSYLRRSVERPSCAGQAHAPLLLQRPYLAKQGLGSLLEVAPHIQQPQAVGLRLRKIAVVLDRIKKSLLPSARRPPSTTPHAECSSQYVTLVCLISTVANL